MPVYIHNQRVSTQVPFSVVDRAFGQFFTEARQIGFSGVAYAFWKSDDIGHNGVLATPTLGLRDEVCESSWIGWSGKYMGELRSLEPVLDACRRTVLPICWGVDSNLGGDDKVQTRYHEESMIQFGDCFKNTGIRNGIAVPIRGANGAFGYVSSMTPGSITDTMWEQMSVKHRAIGLGYEFFSKISDYVDPARDELPKLSRRERECLSLAAKGMTLDGIGDQLGIARSTVRYHLENSILKLDVENRAQAISKAIALRILDPVQQPRDRALK